MSIFKNIAFTLFYFSIFLVSLTLSYSSQFYLDTQNQEYQVFTSNIDPQLSLNFTSKSLEDLYINRAWFNSVLVEDSPFPIQISPLSSQIMDISLPSSIDLRVENVDIELELSSNQESQDSSLETTGDPLKFTLHYISNNTKVLYYSSLDNLEEQELTTEAILRGDDDELYLHFNNRITQYDLQLNGETFSYKEFVSVVLQDMYDTITIDMTSLQSGEYDASLLYTDIAGNTYTQDFILIIADLPLEISKVYSKVDSNTYPYYYHPNFQTQEIYSSSRNYNIQFETNYNATCYVEQVTEFKPVFDVEPFSTQKKKHSIPVEIFDSSHLKRGMWIMCENLNSPYKDEERVYLSEKLFGEQSLLDFVYLPSQEFEITYIYPREIVTHSTPRIEAQTSHESFCEYALFNKENYTLLAPSSNFLTHTKEDSQDLGLGDITVYVRCIDKLYSIKEETLNFEIDPQKSTQLTYWEPKYTAQEYVDFEMEVSDPTAKCSFISRLSTIGGNDLSDETLIEPTRTDNQRLYFEGIGPFTKEGENSQLYLKCVNSQDRVSELNFYVIYDPTPPQISNITLYNSVFGPTTTFSKDDYMRINLNVDSDVEVIDFYTISFENSGIKKNSSTLPIEITDNFSKDTSFTITVTDKLERKSKEESMDYTFDTTPPTMNIKVATSTTTRIVTCNDGFEDCAGILYGTSMIDTSCTPKKVYEKETEIDVFGMNYLCVKAYDAAGNIVNETVSVGSSSNILGLRDFEFNTTPISTKEEEGEATTKKEEEKESNDEEETSFDITDLIENEEDAGFNWIVLSAFAFILLAGGVGGYIAYSRGYLDDQLEMFGIKKNSTSHSKKNNIKEETLKNSNVSMPNTKENSITTNKSSSATKTQEASLQTQNKKYDSHLDKLNDFIDTTLDKKSELFDEFNSNTLKGNVKTFKDTLLENQKSKEDEIDAFEKFYNEKKKKESKETKEDKK